MKQYDDPRWCLADLKDAIDEAATQWRKFADALGGAYTWAWLAQEAALKATKDALEARAKTEEAVALFALNLLTVGVGGPLAGACLKQWGKKATELSANFVKKATEAAKEKAPEYLQKAAEWRYSNLDHPAEDAFKPAAMNPLLFYQGMMEGIEYRTGTLLQLHTELKKELNKGESLGNLQAVFQSIVTSPFISDPPSLEITAADLQHKALMALWISWAWGRDANYWRVHSIDALFGNEAIDFEPIHQSILESGVPERRIGQQFYGGSVAYKELKKLKTFGKNADKETSDLTVINMSGFIDWCNSTDCIDLLFHNLAKKDEWFQEIRAQLQIRRAAGPYARYLNSH